ncbi:hypothetical protein JKP88DRAFT_304290, partial [Tribonema minus]
KPCVVVDLGNAWVRCGFAGECRPRRILRSPLAEHPATMSQQSWLEILSPFLSSMYSKELLCKPKERGVVICESMTMPRAIRQAVTEALFTHLQVPSVLMVAGPAPALYCIGHPDGIVLDIGLKEARVIAVYRGVPLLHTYQAAPLGLEAVHDRLRALLGLPDLPPADAENIVARACFAATSSSADDSPEEDAAAAMSCTLSGSSSGAVVVPPAARRGAADALFGANPERLSVAALVAACARRCPVDARRHLAARLLVAGGGAAALSGLCARLQRELRAAAAAPPGGGATAAAAAAVAAPAPAPAAAAAAAAPAVGPSSAAGSPQGAHVPLLSDAAAAPPAELQGACVVSTPLPRACLLWAGASILAAQPAAARRALTTAAWRERGGALPDWASLSRKDWAFEAPIDAPYQ